MLNWIALMLMAWPQAHAKSALADACEFAMLPLYQKESVPRLLGLQRRLDRNLPLQQPLRAVNRQVGGRIRYFTENEIAELEVYVDSGSGLLRSARTHRPVEAPVHRGVKPIFVVMRAEGAVRMYLLPEVDPEIRRHSSLSRGQGVLMAGEIVVEAGLVTYLQNRSGHYAPNAERFDLFLDWLHDQRADFSRLRIEYFQSKI